MQICKKYFKNSIGFSGFLARINHVSAIIRSGNIQSLPTFLSVYDGLKALWPGPEKQFP